MYNSCQWHPHNYFVILMWLENINTALHFWFGSSGLRTIRPGGGFTKNFPFSFLYVSFFYPWSELLDKSFLVCLITLWVLQYLWTCSLLFLPKWKCRFLSLDSPQNNFSSFPLPQAHSQSPPFPCSITSLLYISLQVINCLTLSISHPKNLCQLMFPRLFPLHFSSQIFLLRCPTNSMAIRKSYTILQNDVICALYFWKKFTFIP